MPVAEPADAESIACSRCQTVITARGSYAILVLSGRGWYPPNGVWTLCVACSTLVVRLVDSASVPTVQAMPDQTYRHIETTSPLLTEPSWYPRPLGCQTKVLANGGIILPCCHHGRHQIDGFLLCYQHRECYQRGSYTVQHGWLVSPQLAQRLEREANNQQ